MLNKIIIFLLGLTAGLMLRQTNSRGEGAASSLTISVDTIVRTIERPREIVVTHIAETLTVVRSDTVVRMVREEKTYTDSSTYLAVVSGYDARLDTLRFLNTVATRTVTVPTRRRHWGIGVTGGAGLTPRGVSPSVTIGLTYLF